MNLNVTISTAVFNKKYSVAAMNYKSTAPMIVRRKFKIHPWLNADITVLRTQARVMSPITTKVSMFAFLQDRIHNQTKLDFQDDWSYCKWSWSPVLKKPSNVFLMKTGSSSFSIEQSRGSGTPRSSSCPGCKDDHQGSQGDWSLLSSCLTWITGRPWHLSERRCAQVKSQNFRYNTLRYQELWIHFLRVWGINVLLVVCSSIFEDQRRG